MTGNNVVRTFKTVEAFRVAATDFFGPDPEAPQLPPTFRGVRMRGMKPRDVVAFQGWCVSGFGARTGAAAATSGVAAVSCFAAPARAADAWAASCSRQQCLYLRPEPQ